MDVAKTSPGRDFCLNMNCSCRRNGVRRRGFDGIAVGTDGSCGVASCLGINFRFGKTHVLPTSSGRMLGTLHTAPVTPMCGSRCKLCDTLPRFRGTRVGGPVMSIDLETGAAGTRGCQTSNGVCNRISFLGRFGFGTVFSVSCTSGGKQACRPVIGICSPAIDKGVTALKANGARIDRFGRGRAGMRDSCILACAGDFSGNGRGLATATNFAACCGSLDHLSKTHGRNMNLIVPGSPSG